MSIEITDGTQALWYITIPNGDWMAGINAQDGGGFKLTHRFRYYRDNEAWDSKDEKRWYSGEIDDLAKGIEAVRLIVQKLKEAGAGQSWEILRGTGSIEEFTAQFMRLPFVHAKRQNMGSNDEQDHVDAADHLP
jgi:hypothetical protein